MVSRLPRRRFGRLQTDSSSRQQSPSDQEQVAEREQREELGAVLGEPPVAGLYIAELPLEDAERVLDLGPHHGDDPVDLLVLGVKRAALGRLRITPQTLPSSLNAASRSALT